MIEPVVANNASDRRGTVAQLVEFDGTLQPGWS